jgi:hypothetical protein
MAIRKSGGNPPEYEPLQELVARCDPRMVPRQDGLGCLSEWQPYFALYEYPWGETSQAK